MKKKMTNHAKLFVLHGIGFVIVCFYGSIAHDLARISPGFFTYMLFPSNLCLWEQGKILLTGMSIWFIIEYLIIGRKIKGFVFIHTIIAVALPILMLMIYMLHSQVFGEFSLEGAHIVLSVALILSGFVTSTIMTLSQKDYSPYSPYGIIIYMMVIIAFALLTFLPPKSGIFYDEIHKVFGPYW